MQTLSAEFSTDVSASWQGEHVIWSSSKLPYLATYSKVLPPPGNLCFNLITERAARFVQATGVVEQGLDST